MQIGVINEQGFPFEDTGMGYSRLNEQDQRTVEKDTTKSKDDKDDKNN